MPVRTSRNQYSIILVCAFSGSVISSDVEVMGISVTL